MAPPKTKAVILIGGPQHGTRFRPLSLQCPKPLMPIAGQEMISHHINACREVAGLEEIFLIGVFDDRKLEDYCRSKSKEIGITVRYFKEYGSLGTAGGIYHFRDQISRGDPAYFFVMHCDLCADFPLQGLLDFHRSRDVTGHSTVMSVKARNDQATNFGCLVAAESGKVEHYVEKPKSFVSDDISCGVYVMDLSVFAIIRQVFFKNHEADGSGADEISLEKEIIPLMTGNGSLYAFKSTAFWSQIKTAGSAIYANRHYLATYRQRNPDLLSSNESTHATIKGDVVIDKSAVVDGTACLGPNVAIGPGVVIGPGARIRDSIILDRVVVDSHAVVLNSIIGWDCRIGEWARVEGHAVGVNPNDPATNVSSRPLFDNGKLSNEIVSILGDNVRVADEVIVFNTIVLPHKDLQKNHKNQIVL